MQNTAQITCNGPDHIALSVEHAQAMYAYWFSMTIRMSRLTGRSAVRNQKNSPFLGLPPEIRNTIYTYTLGFQRFLDRLTQQQRQSIRHWWIDTCCMQHLKHITAPLDQLSGVRSFLIEIWFTQRLVELCILTSTTPALLYVWARRRELQDSSDSDDSAGDHGQDSDNEESEDEKYSDDEDEDSEVDDANSEDDDDFGVDESDDDEDDEDDEDNE
ncbi:hypothetical protein DE146DRAFT_776474 [Phaeosphaeria sp. MPI-PUGE-AT-0046c]|nr:hypothetical protein DE146DRAFT_776474 [Phaeosphaeria sp. MPI-PUGE-AT-0046c]